MEVGRGNPLENCSALRFFHFPNDGDGDGDGDDRANNRLRSLARFLLRGCVVVCVRSSC